MKAEGTHVCLGSRKQFSVTALCRMGWGAGEDVVDI